MSKYKIAFLSGLHYRGHSLERYPSLDVSTNWQRCHQSFELFAQSEYYYTIQVDSHAHGRIRTTEDVKWKPSAHRIGTALLSSSWQSIKRHPVLNFLLGWDSWARGDTPVGCDARYRANDWVNIVQGLYLRCFFN